MINKDKPKGYTAQSERKGCSDCLWIKYQVTETVCTVEGRYMTISSDDICDLYEPRLYVGDKVIYTCARNGKQEQGVITQRQHNENVFVCYEGEQVSKLTRIIDLKRI
jgi:ribosomal protein L35AE/L33A